MRFSDQLITWYQQHKRDLPWRKTSDPYSIWLSEIILQQTRVDQGLNYYHKFIQHYPTVQELAAASQQEVLNLWQGLGYYSRARNMHHAAQYITSELDGHFPIEHNDILALKGVGEYTAAAISSFAYNHPYPVVDGNVYRVLARIFGVKEAIDSSIGKKTFSTLARDLLNKTAPGLHNQAIMEFGALLCTPKKPNCESCPFQLNCHAFKNNVIGELPFKSKKTKVRHRYFNYLVMKTDGVIFLNQRSNKDIWQGLFDFPLIETTAELTNKAELLKQAKSIFRSSHDVTIQSTSQEYIHLLSHQKIHAKFWELAWPNMEAKHDDWIKITLEEINNYPVPKLIENYIKAKL